MAATGVAATGVAATGTGTVILIMFATVSSSSEASAFHGGGVGAGAGVRGGVGTPFIHPSTTVTAILTATDTAMVMAARTDTATAMVNMAMDNMAMPASPESRSCNVGCNVAVITMDPLMESWGHKRGPQSARTNRTTAT